MHLAHAKTRLPEGKRAHCRLGYFLTLEVGLYFPLNLTRVTPIAECFLHIEQIFSAMVFYLMNLYYHTIYFFSSMLYIKVN